MQSPWKVIAAFIGVFIAGTIFGAFFSLGVGARWVNRHVKSPNGPFANMPGAKRNMAGPLPPAMQGAQLLRRLADRLDLTPAQRERIMPLIQRAVQDFRRQQANFFREDGYILQRLQQDIAKELTPDQRKRLNDLQERQREVLRKRMMEWQEMRNARKEGTPPQPTPPQPTAPQPTAPEPTQTPTAPATPDKSATAPAAAPVQPSSTTSSESVSTEKKD